MAEASSDVTGVDGRLLPPDFGLEVSLRLGEAVAMGGY
jgi:hypothetical protein